MIKKRLLLWGLLLVIGITGCSFQPDLPDLQLVLSSDPVAAYPPCTVTLIADGVIGGQYTFEIEGKTYTQPQNTKRVTVYSLPCDATVIWTDGVTTLEDGVTIGLVNEGPVPGELVLNGIQNLRVIHPRWRYIVTFPNANDTEGGPIKLIDVTIEHTGQDEFNTVFCPPYEGTNPPKPDVYHVGTGAGVLENAFVFYSIWKAPNDDAEYVYPLWREWRRYEEGTRVNHNGNAYECIKSHDIIGGVEPGVGSNWTNYWDVIGEVIHGTGLPFTPPSQGESGYPGMGTDCGLEWPRDFIPGGLTIITSTWEDEKGAQTIDVQSIPTMPYPGC